ncbi:MAG: DUF2007 domain-containing protein [Phycisphaerales bacterium]|nr:DUF2007 domain-containing protein [Phycisphaerales bacterium]
MKNEQTEHPDPVVVARYPTEFEASLVRNMLVEAGIPSQTAGGMTAGFRAETPGMVQVLVPGEFAEVAREMIAEQETNPESDPKSDSKLE